MKFLIKILCFLGLLLFVSSCQKFAPLTPKESTSSISELKETLSTDRSQKECPITDPENESDVDSEITDPENEDDK